MIHKNQEEVRGGLAAILETNRGIEDNDFAVIFTGRGIASSVDDPNML